MTRRAFTLSLLLRVCGVISLLSLAGLAWVLAATFLPENVPQPTPNIKRLLVVLVSGGIGFMTNWLAIKMLFRPHRRIPWLVVWPQGLLPREQTRFAHALGRVAAQRLMSPEAVANALADERVHGPLGAAIREEMVSLLADRSMRELLARHTAGLIREQGPAALRELRPELRHALERLLLEHVTPERLSSALKAGLMRFAKSYEARRALAKWIFQETTREGVITRIMGLLQEQFARYRERHPVRGFLAEQFVIDWDQLRKGIVNTLRSPEATEDLAETLVEMVRGILERLEDPGTAEGIAALRISVVERLLDWFENDGLPALADQVREMSDHPRTWEMIHAGLDHVLARLPGVLFEPKGGRLRPAIAARIADLQERLIQSFPVAEIVEKQVLAMDPAMIEGLVDDVGRRELAWIQILGLVLGMIAGCVMMLVV
jgi:uncharacterized membrane protein YheB (UPF0754 family)